MDEVDFAPLQPLDRPAVQCLNEIRVPTLVVAGALDHPEIIRAADVLSSGIVGARKVIMPECAHIPNMEQPRQFNGIVLDFLQTLM